MRARADIIRALGAVLILVVGAVHVEQYLDFIKDVPPSGCCSCSTAWGRERSAW